jgi:hypothetical protein
MAPLRRREELLAQTAAPKTDEDEKVSSQLRMFLNEWYYRILHSSVAKEMTKFEALYILLDVLEMIGVQFKAGDKDRIAVLEEDAPVISKIVECMPQALRQQWDHITLQLQTVMHNTVRVRKAAEVTGNYANEELADVFEDGENGVLQQILQSAVVFATHNVGRLRKIHLTWRDSTNDRIANMTQLHEEGERAAEELEKLESQLADFGRSQNANAKKALFSMFNGQDSVLKSTVFCYWRAILGKLKAEKSVRQRYEDQLSGAEHKLIAYKIKRLENVRHVLTRMFSDGDEAELRDAWAFWTSEVRNHKENGDSRVELMKMRAKLSSFADAAAANAKKVLTRMAGGRDADLYQHCFQAWLEAGRLSRKDKELEEAAKQAEVELKKQLDAKKGEMKQVLSRMCGATDSGLKALMIQHWKEYLKEEQNAKEIEKAVQAQESKLKNFSKHHRAKVRKVHTRVNQQMDANLLQRFFSTWAIETKVNVINQAFTHKYGKKKSQLMGVQNLFKSFAVQLEQNLGDNEERSASATGSRRPSRMPSQKRSGKHRDRDVQQRDRDVQQNDRGMVRDSAGSASLPDIHSRGRELLA